MSEEHEPEELANKEPAITKAMIDAYNKQQAEAEQKAMEACGQALVTLVDQHGFVIMAMPQLTPDGRIVATWGIQKKDG